MIKLLTFDNLFRPLRDIFAKTCCRMMTAITFSRQNDAGSLACTILGIENLVLVVVPVLESKALYFRGVHNSIPANSHALGVSLTPAG